MGLIYNDSLGLRSSRNGAFTLIQIQEILRFSKLFISDHFLCWFEMISIEFLCPSSFISPQNPIPEVTYGE